LNIGQPDIKTPEVAMNAVRNFDVKVLEYSHSAGFESYRSKVNSTQIKDYPSMLKILLQQVDQKLCFCNGSTMDPGEMKSSQNHFTQITMVFLLHLS
jgi:aspartate aminotransferase